MQAMNTLGIPPDALGLGASLVIGLLIGLERGWQTRDLPSGARVAGLRTFALTGLLGGVLGTLLPQYGAWPLVAGLLAVALLATTAYWHSADDQNNLSATSAMAMLLTLVLGAYAATGAYALAFAVAVLATILLQLKPTLHGWLRLIAERELSSALQLLVLSVVILPNLPNQGYGPYNALNPYELWWAVILIAALSLTGHWAMRLTGAQRGLLWTGLLGGLASSTATTLALSRYAKAEPALANAAAAGTLSACGIMFFRMVAVIGLMQPSLLQHLATTLLVPGLVLVLLGLNGWRQTAANNTATGTTAPPTGDNASFDLGTALGFGLFLALMGVLVPAAQEWLGNRGVFALAALSGVADVDAIVISLARQPAETALPGIITATAMGVAALTNTLVKAGIAWTTGGRVIGQKVVQGVGLSLLAGAIATVGSAAWR